VKMFIFGAGFTKAVFPDAPLNKDLISALVTKFSAKELSNLQKRYGTNDIEIALTRLDVDISTLRSDGTSERDELIQLRKSIENKLALFWFIRK
jgi:hypothetical protein